MIACCSPQHHHNLAPLGEHIPRAPVVYPVPDRCQGAVLFQSAPVGDEQRRLNVVAFPLFLCDTSEMVGRQFVVEHNEQHGRRTLIVGWLARGVVAQVGRESVRHGRGPNRPPLPFVEEWLVEPVAAQHAECVRLNRMQLAVEADVTGGLPGRI